MIRDLMNNIIEQTDVRQNLILLRKELKEGYNKTALLYQLGNDYSIFEGLLVHEDAKVRKNVALIIGELALPDFVDKLYAAYEAEEQLFVKSSYLTGIKNLDYDFMLDKLQERLKTLSKMKIEENNKKHINEEVRLLSDMILNKTGVRTHKFTGYHVESNLVLLTNRNFKDVTLEQLSGYTAKEFNAGVIVKTDNLYDIMGVRTFTELLFILDDLKVCENDPIAAATAVANSSIIKFLKTRHEGPTPFYFRIELKTKMELDKKSVFTKKLGAEIERLTNRELINTTSNYEIELRLIENKEGTYNVLLKLFTLKDQRFTYRKETVAASIAPSTAALVANLVKDYIKEDSRILDPFCGVGTMLIERHKLQKANTMYGIDQYADAINKAKNNTEAVKQIIHYINRDFFDFKHDYLFDEIITNMPRVMGHKEEDEIYEIYQQFFAKATSHLEKNGIIILYSHNKDFVYKFMNPNRYLLKAEYEINKKEGTYVFVIGLR